MSISVRCGSVTDRDAHCDCVTEGPARIPRPVAEEGLMLPVSGGSQGAVESLTHPIAACRTSFL